MGRLN